jgi:hypothetical protein
MLSLALIWQRASRILERLETGATRPPQIAHFEDLSDPAHVIRLDVPRETTDASTGEFSRRAIQQWLEFQARAKESR